VRATEALETRIHDEQCRHPDQEIEHGDHGQIDQHPPRAHARFIIAAGATLSTMVAVAALVLTGDWRVMALAITAAVAFVGTSIWWALSVRTHKEIAGAERARAQALSLVAELDRRAAIADERKTMARDLHDVIAGHLSAIAIQSEAALGVLARQESADPAVTGIVGSIRSNSVSALQEMRTMIGLLRATDSINGRVPNSAAGEADPSADPEVRHRGLVNMRERAAALGGSFTAGPASGGWEVLAQLPLSTSAVS
jgi:signal transduction histidine kinase